MPRALRKTQRPLRQHTLLDGGGGGKRGGAPHPLPTPHRGHRAAEPDKRGWLGCSIRRSCIAALTWLPRHLPRWPRVRMAAPVPPGKNRLSPIPPFKLPPPRSQFGGPGWDLGVDGAGSAGAGSVCGVGVLWSGGLLHTHHPSRIPRASRQLWNGVRKCFGSLKKTSKSRLNVKVKVRQNSPVTSPCDSVVKADRGKWG